MEWYFLSAEMADEDDPYVKVMSTDEDITLDSIKKDAARYFSETRPELVNEKTDKLLNIVLTKIKKSVENGYLGDITVALKYFDDTNRGWYKYYPYANIRSVISSLSDHGFDAEHKKYDNFFCFTNCGGPEEILVQNSFQVRSGFQPVETSIRSGNSRSCTRCSSKDA